MFKKLIYIVILPIYPVPVSFQPLPGYTGRYWYPFNLYLDTLEDVGTLSTSTWIHWKMLVPFNLYLDTLEDIGTLSTSTWIHWIRRYWYPFNLYLDTLEDVGALSTSIWIHCLGNINAQVFSYRGTNL